MRTTRHVDENSSIEGKFSDPPLFVLASLADGPKHGHAILHQIESKHGVRLGPGALYGAINRLEAKGYIVPLPRKKRRQPYEITEVGRQFLESQLETLRRLTSAADAGVESPMEKANLPVPSYYDDEKKEALDKEINQDSARADDHNADQLPFSQLGGRRFEILTYLLKRKEFPRAVVTLVKSSGDRGRDILVHEEGVLQSVVQCKNLDHKFARPDLLKELVKFALHDHLEHFISETGVQYELWVPAGLTEPAANLVANWPREVPEKELRNAFERVTSQFKSLEQLAWDEVSEYLTKTFPNRVRLQRYDSNIISQKVRSNHEVYERFFQAIVVMKEEHVKQSIATTLASRLDSSSNQITEKLENLTEAIHGDAIDAEINEARDLVNDRKFIDAEVILRRLQSKKQHLLTKHHRYRIVSNFGAIAFGQGKAEEAAKRFLEAVLLEPEDERARVNEVFAYFLRKDLDKTFKLASELRKGYPLSGRLASMWVTSAPSGTSLEELESSLDPCLLNDAEVSVALARRALLLNRPDRAREYVKSALAAAPQWFHPWLVRASAAVVELLAENTGLKPIAPKEREDLIQAGVADCTRSLELAELEGAWAKAEVRSARCALHLFKGDTVSATEDAKLAYKLDPDNLNVLVSRAQCFLAAGSLDLAIESLEEAYAKEARADVTLMYAKALADRNKIGDVQRAVKVATSVRPEDLPVQFRAAFAIGVLQCFAKKGDWAEAQNYVEKVGSLLEECTSLAARGFVEHARGQIEAANTFAANALRSLTGGTDAITKEFLAGVLMSLDRPADALGLYEELFEKDLPFFDASNLLYCAEKLQLDGKVLDVCEKLHHRRAPDWKLLESEIHYLEKYDSQKAIDRLQEFLRSNPGHKLAQLRLSRLGHLYQRPELVKVSVKDLPAVDELPIEYLRPALGLMVYGEDKDLVIDYAYRFLRIHSDKQAAHEAYIQVVLTTPDRQYPPEQDQVTENSAVLCQELPNGEDWWFVLEDTDKPVRDFEEVSLSDPIAVELVGKRPGDTFVLAHGSLANREAKIKKILPKYVRRFQDSVTKLQVRFGPSAMLQSVPVGDESSVAQPGFVALLASVQDRANQVALLQSRYAEQPISLHLYGSRFNKNSYTAIAHIAQTDGMPLRCFEGNPSEAEGVLAALRERPTILVDLSAVATIRLLRLEWILGSKLYRFAATEATWEELQRTFLENVPDEREKGVLAYDDGRYTLFQEDPQQAAQRRDAYQAFLEIFRTNVQIVPARELAYVEPKTREVMLNYLGRYGAGTVAHAGKQGMLMWCDDANQSRLAATEFKAKYAPTQMILLSLNEAGVLSADDYRKAVARMIGMGYSSVFFDARCVLESAKLADYHTGRFPLKQMVNVFERAALPAAELFRQFLGFFLLLHQEPLLPQDQALVVRAFLDALWRNPSTQSQVLALRAASAKLFGLNVIAESEFNAIFDMWFKSQSRPIV